MQRLCCAPAAARAFFATRCCQRHARRSPYDHATIERSANVVGFFAPEHHSSVIRRCTHYHVHRREHSRHHAVFFQPACHLHPPPPLHAFTFTLRAAASPSRPRVDSHLL